MAVQKNTNIAKRRYQKTPVTENAVELSVTNHEYFLFSRFLLFLAKELFYRGTKTLPII